MEDTLSGFLKLCYLYEEMNRLPCDSFFLPLIRNTYLRYPFPFLSYGVVLIPHISLQFPAFIYFKDNLIPQSSWYHFRWKSPISSGIQILFTIYAERPFFRDAIIHLSFNMKMVRIFSKVTFTVQSNILVYFKPRISGQEDRIRASQIIMSI